MDSFSTVRSVYLQCCAESLYLAIKRMEKSCEPFTQGRAKHFSLWHAEVCHDKNFLFRSATLSCAVWCRRVNFVGAHSLQHCMALFFYYFSKHGVWNNCQQQCPWSTYVKARASRSGSFECDSNPVWRRVDLRDSLRFLIVWREISFFINWCSSKNFDYKKKTLKETNRSLLRTAQTYSFLYGTPNLQT